MTARTEFANAATNAWAQRIEAPDASLFGTDVACSFIGANTLPLVIQPAAAWRDVDALVKWGNAHRSALENAVTQYCAVLLRGFEVDDTPHFERVSEMFPAYDMGYEAGATSRAQISGKVFEATRVPPDVWIMLHQEMAYMRRYPSKLAFYCKTAPEQGGETIIGDMRRFTAALPQRLMSELTQKGVRYNRNFLSPDTQDARKTPTFTHRTWVEAFYTDDRRKVEDDCKARGLEFEWRSDGSISMWNTLPGVTRHASTGETLYFTQIHTQVPHRRWMGDSTWSQYSAVYTDGVPKPFDASFGDGSPLNESDLLTIYDELDKVTVAFPWQHGDVLFVDNINTAHGRNPYKGQRDVQVALIA